MTQLTTVAKTSPLTAQRLLRAIGRFLGPQHRTELQGLSRFLERGGDPRTLARLLSPLEAGEWFIDVQKALRTLGSFSPQASEGLGIFFGMRSDITASHALRVFHNFEPQQIVGIFESLQRLAPRASNLRGLLPDSPATSPKSKRPPSVSCSPPIGTWTAFPTHTSSSKTRIWLPVENYACRTTGCFVRVQLWACTWR